MIEPPILIELEINGKQAVGKSVMQYVVCWDSTFENTQTRIEI